MAHVYRQSWKLSDKLWATQIQEQELLEVACFRLILWLSPNRFFLFFFFWSMLSNIMPQGKVWLSVCRDIRRKIILLIGKFICCKHCKSIFLFLILFLTLVLCCTGWLRDQILSRLPSGEYFHSHLALFLRHILACILALLFHLSICSHIP